MSTDLVKRPSDVAIDTLNLTGATELAKSAPDVAGQLIMALLAQNTDALPGTTFVRRADGAYLKKLRTAVTLRESDGTLVRLGSKKVGSDWVNQYDISISGYRRINEVAAIQVIRPEFVIVDGKRQMNPYIQVDPKTKMPEVVYARCLAVGYSQMGSLAATDVMVRLDINIYMLENIQAKIERAKTDDERDAIGIYGAEDEPPTVDGQIQRGYRFFPIHSVGGIGLWVNVKNRRIQEIFRDHTTRLKFIERLAQSFAERNALKAHPAMPKAVDTASGVTSVRVTGWTNDFDREDIRRLQELAENDRLEEFKDGAGQTIDVDAHVVIDPDEGDRAAIEEEANAEQRHESKEKGDEEGEDEGEVDAAQVDVLSHASEAYGRLVDLRGRKGAEAVLKECAIENLEEAKPEHLHTFIKMVQKIEDE